MWTSLAPSRAAWDMIQFTMRMTGAPSAMFFSEPTSTSSAMLGRSATSPAGSPAAAATSPIPAKLP